MKVVVLESLTVNHCDVKSGEVFLYGGEYYLKTDEDNRSVNLRTGIIMSLGKSQLVNLVDATTHVSLKESQ